MSGINSDTMKLPNGTPPAPPNPDGSLKASRPSAPGQPADAGVASSAKAQLAQLNLANRETTLARVAEIINQQSSGASRLLLDVRGQTLTVNATIGETSLQAGDWVKIMRAGNELQLMGKLAPAAEATIARALAQRLPWQQSVDSGMARVLTTLTTGLRPESAASGQPPAAPLSGATQPLPVGVRQAIEQLAALLPNRQALTAPQASEQAQTPPGNPSAMLAKPQGSVAANQIRQWIEQSGLFAESRTARAADSPPADLKLALGRIIHQLLELQGQNADGFNRLTPIPSPNLVQAPLQFPATATPQAPQASSEPTSVGQMLRLLAGVLNRITVNQLHSQLLTASGGGEANAPASTLLLDLPWLTPQNEPRLAQLRIEQYLEDRNAERNSPTRATTEWRLALAMDLDEAGPLHFDIALRQQTVSARVWAEKQTTLRRVNQELPALRQSLADLGLEVTDLECHRGMPQNSITRLEHRLVDTRA